MTSPLLIPDLKPCPFCGGKAERPHPDRPHGGMVQCVRCGAEAFGPKWNARVSAGPPVVTQADIDMAGWFTRRMDGYSERHIAQLLARHRCAPLSAPPPEGIL